MSDRAPTTDQLRNKIDAGATGEKVGFPDPATVPLGTDAEAGGSAPTNAERRLEAASQTAPVERKADRGLGLYITIALAVVVVLGLVVYLGTRGG